MIQPISTANRMKAMKPPIKGQNTSGTLYQPAARPSAAPARVRRAAPPAHWRSETPTRPAGAAPGETRSAAGSAAAIPRAGWDGTSRTADCRSRSRAGSPERSSLRSLLAPRSSVRLPCRCSSPQVLPGCDRDMIKASSPPGCKSEFRKSQELSRPRIYLQIAGLLCLARVCARKLESFSAIPGRAPRMESPAP
jgi:hypothetical protein